MPGQWPKAKLTGIARLVSRIRSKRSGSLPVQTGFPTSLADLVVKNHDRLKKSSKKRKPPPLAPISNPTPVAAAAVATPTPPVAEEPHLVPEIESSGVLVSTYTRSCNKTSWIGFFVVKLVLLIALVIGGKRLVAGITFWAFVLVVLEAVGERVFGFLKPCSDARRRLRLDLGIGELVSERRERVSPIREIGGLDSIQSERSWVDLVGLETGKEGLVEERNYLGGRTVAVADSSCCDAFSENLAVERRDLVGDGNNQTEGDRRSSRNYKVKKLFRKFIPKKYRGGRVGKNGKVLEVRSRGVSLLYREGEEDVQGSKEEDEKDGNGELPSSKSFYDSSQCRGGDTDSVSKGGSEKSWPDTDTMEMTVEPVGNNRSWSLQYLGFCIIVLFGLVGGKVAALALTLVWFMLAKWTESAWRRWKMGGSTSGS